MSISRVFLVFSVLLSVCFGGAASAAGPVPYINAASNYSVGASAELAGGNFPGKSTISLLITGPKGVVRSELVVSDAEGKVDATILLDEPGVYLVKANDSAGKTLASTRVLAQPARR